MFILRDKGRVGWRGAWRTPSSRQKEGFWVQVSTPFQTSTTKSQRPSRAKPSQKIKNKIGFQSLSNPTRSVPVRSWCYEATPFRFWMQKVGFPLPPSRTSRSPGTSSRSRSRILRWFPAKLSTNLQCLLQLRDIYHDLWMMEISSLTLPTKWTSILGFEWITVKRSP